MRSCWWRRVWPELAALCLVACTAWAQDDPGYLSLRGAVHVHSRYSTGRESLEEIAAQATAHDLDVLVLSDDDLLRVEYGLPFLRQLLSFGRTVNSLVATGSLAAYLDEIRRIDALFPELIVIDGVESAPFYYWEVEPLQRRWILRNWNKHMLAVGLGSAAAYAGLPVSGSAALRVWHWSALLGLWPVLGLLYGWVARRHHPAALRYLVVVVSALCLVNNYPLSTRLWDAYHGDRGAAPYQCYIDYVRASGGMVFWTHPESRSTIEPMRALGGLVEIISETPAHASDLVATRGYTGFAALYGDNITATEPGAEWDQVLTEYLDGARGAPAWGTGDIDYHYDDVARQNRIYDIQTVFLAHEKSRAGVLEAMRSGRMYATRGGDQALLLEGFVATSGERRAVSGEELVASGSASVTALIRKADGAEESVHVRLIRQGQVVAEMEGTTPLEFKHIETNLEPGDRHYYRLLARSRTARMASNPIFVRAAQP